MHITATKEMDENQILLAELRRELNLSPTASTTQIFKAALKLAKEAAERAKEQ